MITGEFRYAPSAAIIAPEDRAPNQRTTSENLHELLPCTASVTCPVDRPVPHCGSLSPRRRHRQTQPLGYGGLIHRRRQATRHGRWREPAVPARRCEDLGCY